MRLSADKQLQMAHYYAEKLKPELGEDFINEIINAPQKLESQIIKQRERVEILKIDCNFLKIQMRNIFIL